MEFKLPVISVLCSLPCDVAVIIANLLLFVELPLLQVCKV